VGLRGAAGKPSPLIRRSWDAAVSVRGIDRVVVATDDVKIFNTVKGFGGEAVMTSEHCQNGTERCAEALAALGGDYDIVVNFQGDALLTPPWFVENLVAALQADPGAAVATPVLRCTPEALAGFRNDLTHGRVGATTAVFDARHNALYFSKEIIPHLGPNADVVETAEVFHHVGVYAYRPAALAQYQTWTAGPLERREGLEQLRFLENGHMVKCVEVNGKGRTFWELNNPEDVPLIEAALKALAIE